MKTQTTRQDMQRIRGLMGDLMVSPHILPVSFRYAGKAYSGLPQGGMNRSHFADCNVLETDYSVMLDHNLQLRAEIVTYRDYSAVEWTLWFENIGKEDSAILENLNAADLTFYGESPRLLTNNGDPCGFAGYQDTFTDMPLGTVVEQAPRGGRSCDSAFPYQRILFDDYGYSIAIGWPGQWHCCWEGTGYGAHFTAGQETVHTVIRPGERFRSPRISIQSFEGDLDRGINMWRRWYYDHVLPKAYGQPLPSMVMANNNGGGWEWTIATEQQQRTAFQERLDRKSGAELWWIDAGWYPCLKEDGTPDWHLTGTWEPDPARFPNGLKPIGDLCRAAGMEFVLWFEPERIRPDTWLPKEHPEWIIDRKPREGSEPNIAGNLMLNLTNPECLKWLCEHVNRVIQESNVTAYRQDFNFQPLPYWRENEEDDRQGMVENLYIQGYLAYWDYLLMHNPNLMIDSCASGGRRNDLETMRRSVPFHQTDFGYGHHPIRQKFSQLLYAWIPYFRGFCDTWDNEEGEYIYGRTTRTTFEEYDYFCSFAPMMTIANQQEPEIIQLEREMVALYKRVRHHLREDDFYPLTEQHYDRMKWTVWQFYSPETDSGILQFFRNNGAPEEEKNVRLKALCPESVYLFENGRTGQVIEMTGEKAMTEGFTEAIGKRQASLWIYTKKNC